VVRRPGGEVLSINWFEEKETRKFLGAGVVEFDTAGAAHKAGHCNIRVFQPDLTAFVVP